MANAIAVNATGLPMRPHFADHAANHKVDARRDEAAERSGECEGSGPDRCPVLFRQPQTEDGEVAAKEAKEEQHSNERMESLWQVKRPAETKHDADQHAEEIESQSALATNALRQQRNRKAA